jgi:hypothetical protein
MEAAAQKAAKKGWETNIKLWYFFYLGSQVFKEEES